MRFRRLCIDVDDAGQVLGGSIEFFGDRKVDPEQIAVLSEGDWSGLTPHTLLDVELSLGWYQPSIPFPTPGSSSSH